MSTPCHVLIINGGRRVYTRPLRARGRWMAGSCEERRASGTLSKPMPVMRTAWCTGNVAAACDGAAVERGRGREAGVLWWLGRARRVWYGWTHRPTCSPFRRRGRRRLKVPPENMDRMSRLAPLGIYIMSLATDPIRGNHRLDPNATSSATLMSRPVNAKSLNDRHLSHDDPTVWVMARMADNA